MSNITYRTNPFTGMRYAVLPTAAPLTGPADEDECWACDGTGRVYNNADRTSGQWVPCDCQAGGDA